jgi:hypothetical protein
METILPFIPEKRYNSIKNIQTMVLPFAFAHPGSPRFSSPLVALVQSLRTTLQLNGTRGRGRSRGKGGRGAVVEGEQLRRDHQKKYHLLESSKKEALH